MSLAAGSARTFLLRLVTLAVQVPTSILLARYLGVEGKGAYTLLTVIPWLVTFVALCGLDTAAAYMLSGGRASLKAVVRLGAQLLIILTPVAGAAYLWLVAPRTMEALPGPLVLLSVILVPLVISRYLVLAVLLGYEKTVAFNLIYLYTSLAILVLTVLFLAGLGYGLKGALAGFILAQALILPLGVLWIGKISRTASRPAAAETYQGWFLLKKCLAYGLKGHPAGVLVTFNQRFEILLLGALAGPSQVGIYAVAVAIAETVWHVPMSVHLNLFPRVAAVGAEEGRMRLPRAVRMTLLLSAGLTLLLALFGRLAVKFLYGPAFLPAFAALAALLPGVLAVSVSNVFESYFAGTDRRHFQSIAVGCAFALSVILDLWLIPLFGALGAGIASTASYTLQMVIVVLLFRRLGGIAWREYFLPRRADLRELIGLLRSLFNKQVFSARG